MNGIFQNRFSARSVSLIYVLTISLDITVSRARKKHVSSAWLSPSLHLHCIVKTRIYISMNVSDVRVDIVVLSRRFEDSARGDRNRRHPRCRLSLVAIVASRFPPLFLQTRGLPVGARDRSACKYERKTRHRGLSKTRNTRDILFNAKLSTWGCHVRSNERDYESDHRGQ